MIPLNFNLPFHHGKSLSSSKTTKHKKEALYALQEFQAWHESTKRIV